jgi:CheY-like chemotaxis protein
MGKRRILVADDQEPIRVLLKMSLERLGFEVSTAKDGREALGSVRENPPDLIITDVMMPEMDGYEVLTQLHSDPATAGIPAIVLTALEEESYQEKSASLGAVDHLVKPVSLPALKQKVLKVLGEG